MKRCKCGGDSMRDLDVLKADRISELPEALILKILSLLPTKDAIATSVLSKEWRSLWKMLPKLKFDSNDHKTVRGIKTFSTNVCRSLLSHKAPVLKSLHLNICFSRCTAVDAGILIGIALTRKLRKLVIQSSKQMQSFIFPRCLLYNCETLETLKLKFSGRIDVPSSVCLKSLKTLHLDYVAFKNDESIFNLLSGCPKLENLMVHPYFTRGGLKALKAFKIVVPSLQRLSIFGIPVRPQHWGYVINAPSLKYLKIEGVYGLDFCLIENAPNLVEASIIDVSDIINDDNLLGSLTSVTRLSLGLSLPLKIKFPTGSIFGQLVYLELYTNKVEWWNLLTLMLVSSPKLQVLKLIDPRPLTDLVPHGKWNQPSNVAECLLLHLETFLWDGYKYKVEEEKEVAKYILRNASCLKKANFSIKGLNSDERLEVLEELESVVKVNNSSCQLVLLK